MKENTLYAADSIDEDCSHETMNAIRARAKREDLNCIGGYFAARSEPFPERGRFRTT